jgi:prepilin-type N-terminal cleavage/methylation domain-containing protein/prepilin-type processing-associated H-X9-DG protein
MRHNPTRPAPRKRAFTLIELLVVVAIIALLISILLPALSNARQQGRAVACAANLRSLGLAVTLYADANRGWLPEWGFGHGGGNARAEFSWLKTMGREYAEQQNVLRCPIDRSPSWSQPRVAGAALRRTSFATNFYVTCTGIDNPLYELYGHGFDRLDWITHPSTTIIFCELAETGQYAEADHVHADYWEAYYPADRKEAEKQVALARHLQQANYGLLDGHAERLPYLKTYQPNPIGPDPQGRTQWLFNKYDPTVAR